MSNAPYRVEGSALVAHKVVVKGARFSSGIIEPYEGELLCGWLNAAYAAGAASQKHRIKDLEQRLVALGEKV